MTWGSEKSKMNRTCLLGMFFVILGTVPLSAGITPPVTIHVPADQPTIQAAIDLAASGFDEVLVAPGTYAEAINFNGKAIVVRSASGDPNDTIIDGGGSVHVVQCISGETEATELHGFTITGGNANGGGFPETVGGGLFCDGSSPTITDCVFALNLGGLGAGAYLSNNSNAIMTNCTFDRNVAGVFGGAMYNSGDSSPALTGCRFVANRAGSGAAIYNTNVSSPLIAKCSFIGNIANNEGGAVYNVTGSDPLVIHCIFRGNIAHMGAGLFTSNSLPMVINCAFSGNHANASGGAMSNSFGGNSTIINCSFARNSADVDGGAISNLFASSATIVNSILWDNTPDQIVSTVDSMPLVTFSDIQGGYLGTGNIDIDPQFIDPNGVDGIIGTDDDDLHLPPGSPCIDAGDSAAAPAGLLADLDGKDRFVEVVAKTDTGAGPVTFGDMGAYEFQPCIPQIPADINCDGNVNALDYALLALHWLEMS
jgi:hypothetical protein